MSRPDLRWLRLCTAAVFDIAAIIMFVKFALLLAEPIKLVLNCVIFAVGIIPINGILVLPALFLRNGSFPYRVSFVLLSIVYFLVSNFISLLFVSGSIVWYTGWELFILALYVGIYAVLAFFAQLESKDRNNTPLEQDARNSIRTQLMNIETSLAEKNIDGTISSVLKAFKLLKERIHASTPFGRITGNSEVMELENRVRVNLEFLQLHTKSSIHDGNKNDILKLIEETQGLLSNREALNVK